jgi:hypothetical protein
MNWIAEVATGIWESDRLRPAAERNRLDSEGERQFHDAVAGAVAKSMSPEEFAAQVFAAIEADRFWIVPDDEFFRQVLELRTRCTADIMQLFEKIKAG